MIKTRDELHHFAEFARERLESEGPELSLDELFDLWRSENPSAVRYAENVAAVNAAIQDFRNGDRGTPAGEHSDSLRREFGISL
ncbi:MAG: hypothetical protein WD045_06080 [Pirellulaceae bacterium]